MRYQIRINEISVLTLALTAINLFAQNTPQSQGGLGGMLGQGKGMLGGKGGVSVQMVDAVDSNAGGGRTFRATVATATTVAGVAVPQGSSATTTLQQTGNGWTLALTSITANGQAIPVTSTFASTRGGSLANSATSILNGGGLPWQRSKSQPAAANTPKIAASGARVYVPANTNVTFMVSAAAQQTAQNQPAQTVAQSTPTATPIAATPTAPVQASPMATSQALPQSNAPGAAPSSNAVIFGNTQYQLSGCHREAPHIVCELQVMNIGQVDSVLSGDPRTYFIDQSGNKGGVQSGTLANCNLGRCPMLPQIAMKARYVFNDDTGESRTLVRLQIWAGGRSAVAQFNNVPVQ